MDNIINYFNGERIQCFIGLLISIIFITASVYFLFLQKPFFKGVAYVALPLSTFLIAICIGVITRTSGDIDRVTTYYKSNPDQVRTEELPRMEKVMRNFAIIKKVEMGLFILGIVLAISFWSNHLMRGIAVALIVEGVTLYLFDHIAELRGIIYIRFLTSSV
ncbi:MAG: hypothetical protein AAF363_21865 [Bacteroidota bacterium]